MIFILFSHVFIFCKKGRLHMLFQLQPEPTSLIPHRHFCVDLPNTKKQQITSLGEYCFGCMSVFSKLGAATATATPTTTGKPNPNQRTHYANCVNRTN